MQEFSEDKDALRYLQENVSPESEREDVDISDLKKPLFEKPDKLTPGEYEFEGKGGFKVSFKIVKCDNRFDTCYSTLKESGFEGKWHPIYGILDLTISSDEFGYSMKYPSDGYAGSIYWLPGLSNPESELSCDTVDIGKRNIYLVGDTGFFARPLDLLGFFHEIGHLATDPMLPHNEHTSTYGMFGTLPMTPKRAAYQLQREKVANDWLSQNTNGLFRNLEVPSDLVQDYCDHVQLKSYRDASRRRLERFLKDL